jgi:hypothetical protein
LFESAPVTSIQVWEGVGVVRRHNPKPDPECFGVFLDLWCPLERVAVLNQMDTAVFAGSSFFVVVRV